MADSQENKQKEQNDVSEKNFMIEKIKERPVNKKKLLRRTLITVSMAVIFGLVACFTFLVLEPVISNWLYPEEEPQVVVFPEDQDEMSPEQMLAENMQQENQNNQSSSVSGEVMEQEQIRELSKLLDLGEQSFDSFSLDYYSPLPWPGESLSPRENMEFIFDVCSSYARKFGRFYFRNLFLTGAPGLGKTFLSACIARTVSESGFSVVYDTAVNIFTRFEEQKFARDRLEAGEAKDETRRYLGCDLLILDDLGSELSTPFVQSALYTLINTRLTADKRTVISSNLTMDQVRARYTPQIASRLEGEYRVLPFYGEDIRLLRKQTL